MSYLDKVAETLRGLRVSPGDEVDEFSFLQCESCGSELGGPRNQATAYDRESKEIFELSICGDCVLFHANGELPGELE